LKGKSNNTTKERRIKTENLIVDTSIILEDTENLKFLYENKNVNLFINDIVLKELNKFKDESGTERGALARVFFNAVDNAAHKPISRADAEELGIDPQLNDKFYYLIARIENIEIPIYIISRRNYNISKVWDMSDVSGLNDAKIQEIAEDYHLGIRTNDRAFKFLCRIEGLKAEGIDKKKVENFNQMNFRHDIGVKNIEDCKIEVLKYIKENELYKNVQLVIQEEKEQLNEGKKPTKYKTGKIKHALVVSNIETNANIKKIEFELYVKILDFDKEQYEGNAILPLNTEQKFYSSLLSDQSNEVFAVHGATGSGKTLLALQMGVMLYKKGIVDGIVYTRNTITANEKVAELGFRKGSEEDKLNYFMYPIYNAINFTIEKMIEKGDNTYRLEDESQNQKGEATQQYMKDFNIETVDIAHFRGITISKKFIIVDESQNTTDGMMKLIGTRVGEKGKIAFLGDVNQVDHPFLSKKRNGLLSLMKKSEKDNYVTSIKLVHTIRSEISSWFDKNF